ncbi:uncharacterized protein N7518_003173 [Penicillium psychrosexuale]|uniref:uncharacterized protein n=1 Tax=Penicillium psychrosexuale TaxID=1002107 RepID=UPI00254521F4|nr:uncharacterized protein N7518_003173 [Penicillium psychrosexuale]KAJ5801105.1 hypothetical protein N7518_003173 [Penicillium psychrosexuale]
MDEVCQQIVQMICEVEVQHLLKRDGVRDASFGQAVAHNPNGDMIANGYISKMDITGFSQKTKRTSWHDRSRRWDCDVTIGYNVIQEYTKMDESGEDFSRPPIQAVNDLRQQFANKYQI